MKYSPNWLSGKFASELRSDLKPAYGPERISNIKHSNTDISKGRKLVGYDPEYNFEKGIEETIKWYKENI